MQDVIYLQDSCDGTKRNGRSSGCNQKKRFIPAGEAVGKGGADDSRFPTSTNQHQLSQFVLSQATDPAQECV